MPQPTVCGGPLGSGDGGVLKWLDPSTEAHRPAPTLPPPAQHSASEAGKWGQSTAGPGLESQTYFLTMNHGAILLISKPLFFLLFSEDVEMELVSFL